MGQIVATVTGAVLPISVVVRKIGETTGNRCTGDCDEFPITFTDDPGPDSYYFIVTDADDCVVDSRVVDGGVSNINCDPTDPDFDAELIQPVCDDPGYTQGILRLTNITNGVRYKICYNTLTMNCAACTDSDGVISGSSLDIPLVTPTNPTNKGVLIRVYADASCTSFKEWFGTMITPECIDSVDPDFAVQFLPPPCTNETNTGVLQNGLLRVTNITNATRYKICYNSTDFASCVSTCSSSDGFITGTMIDIPIIPAAQGITQNVTVRVFNGPGCTKYKDITFPYYSQKCGVDTALISMDLTFGSGGGCNDTGKCNPASHINDYNMYMTLNTPAVTENGQWALTKGGANRVVPNGNDVPNIMIVAAPNLSCGPNAFYRFQMNMNYLKARYPAINTFVFDLYVSHIKNLKQDISVSIRTFKGVTMKKKPVNTGCNGLSSAADCTLDGGVDYTDAGREPCDPDHAGEGLSIATVHKVIEGVGTTAAFKKMGILTYSYISNSVTWTTNVTG